MSRFFSRFDAIRVAPRSIRTPLRWRAALTGLAVLLIAGTTPRGSSQQGPTVAAAANLNPALSIIAQRFARDKGEQVQVVYGASAVLARQIQDGAPFELFLSADETLPQRLTDAGLTRDAGAAYAVGRLVLYAPNESPLVIDERLDGLRQLLDAGKLTRFAIANPAVAPYGRAAEAVLRKHDLWTALESKLVFGDTIAQTAQFAANGDTVGGLLAHSIVIGAGFADRGRYVVIPATDHPPIRQRMVLLKNAGPVAERFYEYVQSAAAERVFRRHGYGRP